MGAVSDGFMAGCHVVGKIPALGVVICLVATGDYANVIPVDFLNQKPQVTTRCVSGDEYLLIDIEKVNQHVAVGECLQGYTPVTHDELLERCARPEARFEEICLQVVISK